MERFYPDGVDYVLADGTEGSLRGYDSVVLAMGTRSREELRERIAAFVPQVLVVGEAASGEEFLAMLPELKADIVFMDFAMPGIDGAQATERALARRPDLRIITLSMFGEESYYTRMVQAGARGFLLKDSDIGDVVEAIDTVMAGGSYFSPQLLSSLAGRMRTREDVPDEELSAREREILVAVCRGLSNQEIADELFISKRTVDKHRANILEKTGCKNTASLVVYAVRHGLVDVL